MIEKIKETMSIVFGIDEETISNTVSQDDIENWDSLNHMNLVVALEEEFQVQFTDEEILELMNLPLIVEILKEKGVK